MFFSSSFVNYFDGIRGAGFGAYSTSNTFKRIVDAQNGAHGIGGAYSYTHQAADAEALVKHNNALSVNR